MAHSFRYGGEEVSQQNDDDDVTAHDDDEEEVSELHACCHLRDCSAQPQSRIGSCAIIIRWYGRG